MTSNHWMNNNTGAAFAALFLCEPSSKDVEVKKTPVPTELLEIEEQAITKDTISHDESE